MAATIPFQKHAKFPYGVMEQVAPGIRRIVADNPGPFTFTGTGTYVVGVGVVAVIDPGPDLAAHITALAAALEGETVSHILITHTHRDHSPASRPLQALTGAPILAFSAHGATSGDARDPVEEGADTSFEPDHRLANGDTVSGPGWTLEAVHTPGHTANHLCFHYREQNALFSGDHVMGWSTTVVSPPDGNMADYMASLHLLTERGDGRYWPTHGLPIEAPQDFVRGLITHREGRERQILNCIAHGSHDIPTMVSEMYRDVPEILHPAAARSVLAHIIHLVDKNQVTADGPLTIEGRFHPIKP